MAGFEQQVKERAKELKVFFKKSVKIVVGTFQGIIDASSSRIPLSYDNPSYPKQRKIFACAQSPQPLHNSSAT
ncbi:hypothetical protein CCACVL1_00492 [Corchorus capsularis]|uniref:Uncharacterized protein n=1 Tax=Corchorus capsularis TaxID=210143 RepID=A0A1R3KWP6_COCAP|nr:hypothetical protein CCACVL1_00492 [Corchorus capsularis]